MADIDIDALLDEDDEVTGCLLVVLTRQALSLIFPPPPPPRSRIPRQRSNDGPRQSHELSDHASLVFARPRRLLSTSWRTCQPCGLST